MGRSYGWAVKVFAPLVLMVSLAFIPCALAHYTLGDSDGTLERLRANDSEYRTPPTPPFNHVRGPLGWVFPGAGMYPSGQGWAWGYGFRPGIDVVNGYDPSGLLAGQGNDYSGVSAILASDDYHPVVGDLIFALNYSGEWPAPKGQLPMLTYTKWTIYIPLGPDEGFMPANGINWDAGDTSNIVTTVTNDYNLISVARSDDKDPFGPNMWVIEVYADNYDVIKFTPDEDRWYYIRINGLIAPKVAGVYFFKMFLDDAYPTSSGPIQDDPATPDLEFDRTVPMENYPCLLVKGDIDPAYVHGVVRFGAPNTDLYGKPINLPGRVYLEGESIDPYAWPKVVPTGRRVRAVGYFNETAFGRFEVEGVAPGIYNVYASAAGYPTHIMREKVTVGPGQSLYLELSLTPGAVITGTVYSKHGFGTVPWPDHGEAPFPYGYFGATATRVGRPIAIEIIDERDRVRSFSPINLTDAPFTSYVWGNVRWDPSTGYSDPLFTPKEVSFPWSYYSEGGRKPYWNSELTGFIPWDKTADAYPAPYNAFWEDGVPNGVGPSQVWWVAPGFSHFHFAFGLKDWFGAPIDMSGRVPQVFATWTNGLVPGTYRIRAYVNGYVQVNEYTVTVPRVEYPGDVHLEMDLQLSSSVNVTVHFLAGRNSLTPEPLPVPEPGLYLIGEMYNSMGDLAGFNFTFVGKGNASYTLPINGFGMAGPHNNVYFGLPASIGMKWSLYRYRGLRDYGLAPDTYTVKLYIRGYHQLEELKTSISLCGAVQNISIPLIRGGSVNITIFPVDWEHPQVSRCWLYGADPANPLNPGGESARVVAALFDERGVKESYAYIKYLWDQTANTYVHITQKYCEKSLPYPGWPPGRQKIVYNGSNYAEVFGPDGTPRFDSRVALNARVAHGMIAAPMGLISGDYYPTALKEARWQIRVWTYGYVQERFPEVYTPYGALADTRVDLVEGARLDITMIFKKEGLIDGTPFPLSARIRVYDENDRIAAADTWYYIPEGVETIRWAIAGFAGSWQYQNPLRPASTGIAWEAGRNYYVDPSRAATARYRAMIPYVDRGGEPILTVDQETQLVYGIPGGVYKVEVDLVPLMFYGPINASQAEGFIPGLLSGELGKNYKHKWNHIGPYQQRVVPEVHVVLGGEASPIFEFDLRGAVTGYIYTFYRCGGLRPGSWITVSTGYPPIEGDTVYTFDGYFDMYLNPGHYILVIYEWTPAGEGHQAISAEVNVSPGQAASLNYFLERSGIAIPETSMPFETSLFTAALSILGISLRLHGRRRRKS
ncbi:MAG: carboxypeptidase-like regulatory domain-containing protein [Candidatus Bathyarchaeia archaeon]|nr:carboxypeptidase regulatory-like domain-containing protein [Candidatus Bathyarchaeota archaeon]